MAVNVDEVMRGIEDEVRNARRQRLLAHGAAPEYRDPRIYALVESILRRAVDGRDHDALLLSEIAAGDDGERLATHLRFASHRGRFGPVVIFAKRRILLPAMRWLYEYSLHNFRRQDRLNRILFACLEELAIENARLRISIAGMQEGGIPASSDAGIAGAPGGRIVRAGEAGSAAESDAGDTP